MVAAYGGIRRRWHDRPCCSPDRTILAERIRLQRRATVVRLTVRNGMRIVGARGARKRGRQRARAPSSRRATIRTAEDVARELGQMKGADESRSTDQFHRRGPSRGGATGVGDPPGRRAADGSQPRRRGRARRARRRSGADLPGLVAGARSGSLDQPGPPSRHPRRPHRRSEVQYPGVGEAIEADLAERRDPLRHVRGVRAEGSRHTGTGRRAAIAHGGGARLPPRGAESAGVRRALRRSPVRADSRLGPGNSRRRVLTTEWIDGDDWATFVASAGDHARQRAGEIIWRFAQASILRMGAFNGDPGGNYRFHDDGTVTFLDFGLVKRWSPGEWERLAPSLDAIYERDPDRLVSAMEAVEFPATWHGLDAGAVYDYVSAIRPVPRRRVHLHRELRRRRAQHHHRPQGAARRDHREVEHAAELRHPGPRRVGCQRVLGKLGVTRPWRAMLLEYQAAGPAATSWVSPMPAGGRSANRRSTRLADRNTGRRRRVMDG